MTKKTPTKAPRARRKPAGRFLAPTDYASPPLKLDLGAGAVSPEGFRPLGNAHGTPIYPLPPDILDGSVDVIRASHVLEHFPAADTVEIVTHWVTKLKPGGLLQIAVPDFDVIATDYKAGHHRLTQGYVMGGQSAPDDFHKTIFDLECLAETMRLAGLIELARWESSLPDCASLPVSLNLQGVKPRRATYADGREFRISAVMSMPRLGFTDNYMCAMRAFTDMGIRLRAHTGAFWEASLERAITETIAEDQPDAILTLDYDTVFTQPDVEKLRQIMLERPEVDALAPMQSARHRPEPLLTMDMPLGSTKATAGVFADDITRLKTAHFGLTLIRTSSLEKLPKPWLHGKPAPDGTWGEGREDADISFWRAWARAGLSLYSANRVAIGHLELMVLWPGKDFSVLSQLARHFSKNGKPKEAWS